jgi:hypothetical protein
LPTTAALSTLWSEIDRLGFTVKKTPHAENNGRPDVAAARRQRQTWQPLWDTRQYVFLDECGVATDLLRRYGRSPMGTRLRDHTPCSHWDTHTVVTALRLDGLTAPAVFNGPIDNPSFLAYVEQVLVPTLRPGDVVVLDNLAATNNRRCMPRSPPAARGSAFFRPTAPTSIRSNWRADLVEGPWSRRAEKRF